MPLFNSANYLDSLLDNLLKQTNQDFELVFIDALSTDSTLQILEQRKKHFKNVKLISEPDNGIYDAMNKGVSYAKGEWIYFMGSDDRLVNENVLGDMLSRLTPDLDIVYGDCIWLPENNKEYGEWTYEIFINRNINHQRIFYRKKIFDEYGGFNLKYKIESDHELNIRFFCNDKIKKKHVPITVAYFHSGGFSSRKLDEIFWNDWNLIVLKNFNSKLSKKTVYGSLGTYIRYLVNNKNYLKAFKLTATHFYNTQSFGFLRLIFKYLIHSRKNENRNSTLLAY